MRPIKVAVNLGSELLESSLITGAGLDGYALCFTGWSRDAIKKKNQIERSKFNEFWNLGLGLLFVPFHFARRRIPGFWDFQYYCKFTVPGVRVVYSKLNIVLVTRLLSLKYYPVHNGDLPLVEDIIWLCFPFACRCSYSRVSFEKVLAWCDLMADQHAGQGAKGVGPKDIELSKDFSLKIIFGKDGER